jgi:excinuclease ABC subunit A
MDYIEVKGAREHNLKNIDIKLPKNKLIVVTGLSGSGKSSLVFDIIYNEGQRRYVESMSSYVRQFLEMHNKPDVESISGLSPAIAIDQKTTSRNPRSTVGTITEIYDYLRLLFARVGVPFSPETGKRITSQSISEIIQSVLNLPRGASLHILAPIARGDKGEFHRVMLEIKRQGFEKVIINGNQCDIHNLPLLDKEKKHNIEVLIDRVQNSPDSKNRISNSIETAMKVAKNGFIYIKIADLPQSNEVFKVKKGQILVFSEKYACPVSGFQFAEIEPRMFSFNTPFGSCNRCQGLGMEMNFDSELIVPNKFLSINQGAIKPWDTSTKSAKQTMMGLSKHYNFSLDQPFNLIPEDVRHVLLHGSKKDIIEFQYTETLHDGIEKLEFAGIIPSLESRYAKDLPQAIKDELAKYRSEGKCTECNGYRLRQESLWIKIDDKNIGEVSSMPIRVFMEWIDSLHNKLNEKDLIISSNVLKEIKEKAQFLINVGLDYLTLIRESRSLSGGESQRIRLASQLGSKLTGVLYVLDEPSIGLHQRDNEKLIDTLKGLRDLGNTVIVVEHDHDTIMEADFVVDIGPAAGEYGGEVIFAGSVEDLLKSEDSITGIYLSKRKCIEIPKKSRQNAFCKSIGVLGATTNNLQNVDLKINLGTFTSVTGVSGGGKSSLILDTLYRAAMKQIDHNFKDHPGAFEKIIGVENIDKIIDIDQSPIGRTPRSNPATYTSAFSNIRDWFTDLPESKARGYKIGRFSFNVKGGRCEACQGDGLVKIEMHFLPDVYVKCDLCKGKRYNKETLEIKYKGKSIADVLEMNVGEALSFFDKVPSIRDKMQTLYDVGLSYIKIGQSAVTLSGGEAQRIKLAKELSRKSTGKTLYILDEPTTGLHVADVQKLLEILHKLVDMGNTVVVIEHNMDVIKTSDYIIDIGPEGGAKGGRIIAQGTPEEICNSKDSITGYFLKQYM